MRTEFPVSLTDEQMMLRDSLQHLLQDLESFEQRRHRLSAPDPDRMALWEPLTELGVPGALLDEAHGGFDGSVATVAMIAGEFGRFLVVEPLLETAMISTRLLAQPIKQEDAPSGVVEGAQVVILAHDSGADPFAGPRLQARRSDGGIVVSGVLRAVRHADVADEFLIPLMLEGKTVLYRVPSNATGLEVRPFRTLDGAGAGDLMLEHLSLDQAIAGKRAGEAEQALTEALEWGLFALVAETHGIVSALNGQTFEYLGSRQQFGQPLAAFQALQHRAADMHIAAEELSATLAVLIEAFTHPPSPRRSIAISAAKVVADVTGHLVGNEAVQMHGAMGVSDELIVSHYFRRLATIRQELGTADIHRLRYGSLTR